MPIEGRTLWEACHNFCDYLNRVLATTVKETRLVPIGPRNATRLQVAFRGGGGRLPAALLRTRFGPMALYIGQLCETIQLGDARQRLVTVEYRYTLTPGDLDEAAQHEPLLRWEYVREPEGGGRWCRHHLQGAVQLEVGREAVSLNDLHLPTGYVTIEEVLRFCIVDLGVDPQSARWHEILEESYERFKTGFAPRGYI